MARRGRQIMFGQNAINVQQRYEVQECDANEVQL